MKTEIVISENDRIAVIAPHPDDECIGAAAVLLVMHDHEYVECYQKIDVNEV